MSENRAAPSSKDLSSWHQEWCATPMTDVVLPTATDKGSESTQKDKDSSTESAPVQPSQPTTRQKGQSPLLRARMWIKNSSQQLSSNPALLKAFLKEILVLDNSTKNSTDNDSTQTKTTILRHLEWQIVLLLELRVRCGTFVAVHFAKVHNRLTKATKGEKKSKRKQKRKRTTSLPEQVYQDHLRQLLTKVAFALPSTLPLVTFLCDHCLTSYMWKRIPHLVTSLFDYFEIDNPYLAPKEHEVNDDDQERQRKKEARRAAKKRKTLTTEPPARARLPLKRKTPLRTMHFHSKLMDMTKLLRTPATATAAISAPLSLSRTASKNTTSLQKPASSRTVTPAAANSSASSTQQKRDDIRMRTPAPNNPIISPNTAIKSDPAHVKSPMRRPSKASQPQPAPLHAPHTPVPRSSSVAAQSPLPPTTSCKGATFVGETPQSKPTGSNRPRVAAETPSSKTTSVQETPLRGPRCQTARTTHDLPVLETPVPDGTRATASGSEQLFFSPGILTPLDDDLDDDDLEANNHQPANDLAKPLNLFRRLGSSNTLQPKSTSRSSGSGGVRPPQFPHVPFGPSKNRPWEDSSRSSIKEDQTAPRPTSITVAAARSFLRRKSM